MRRCFNKALLKGRSSDGFLVAPTIPNAAAIATAVFYGASAAMAAASAQAGQANLKQGEPQWQQRRQLKASCFKTLTDEDFWKSWFGKIAIFTVSPISYMNIRPICIQNSSTYTADFTIWDTKNPW